MAGILDNINPGFVNWISSAMNAFSAFKQGSQQQDYYNYRADQSAADANTARELGSVQADRVRTAGRYTVSSARAGFGAAGVDVNAGSATDVQKKITAGSELDAWTQILQGNRAYTSGMNNAAALRVAGANAMNQGYAGVSKSLLSGVGDGVKEGWKTRVKPEQYPAPVEDRMPPPPPQRATVINDE